MEAATVTALEHRRRIVPWRMLGDDVLAQRAAQGSESAFTALYERYHAPLLSYCRSILLDGDDAHDAAQSALEKALRALPDRDPGRPLRPWLYRIAHNEAIDIVRRRGKHLRLVPGADEPAAPGPEVDAEQRVRLTQLVDDLRSLPDRQRGALVMRELSGLDYEEIGLALGLTAGAARQAVFEARTALHDCSDGREDDCTGIRRTLSDGDRRALRGRRLRAHLRSCQECRQFSSAIRARRVDLPALSPWLSGATAAGMLGFGAGGAGGGALVATGGVAASAGGGLSAAGGGIGWAGLSAATKGIVVAAAVATTGGAAYEVNHVVTPSPKKVTAHSAQAPGGRGASATTAAGAAVPVQPSPEVTHAARRLGDAVRTSSEHLQTSLAGAITPRRYRTPAPLAPVQSVTNTVKPILKAPAHTVQTVKTTAKKVAQSSMVITEDLVKRSLIAAREQVLRAFALAEKTASAGTQGALQIAKATLGATLTKIADRLRPLLAKVGLKLPTPSTTPGAAANTTGGKGLSGALSKLFSGLQDLLKRLFHQG